MNAEAAVNSIFNIGGIVYGDVSNGQTITFGQITGGGHSVLPYTVDIYLYL